MIATIVSKLWVDSHKERHEMVLEPLQAMSMLALLAFCPVGTKLSIVGNLVHIQVRSWNQAVTRAYRADGKEDLVYLFGVVRRFNKFYVQREEFSQNNEELIKLLQHYGKIGLERLTETYSGCENGGHLAQTLKMYNSMLARTTNPPEEQEGLDSVFINITSLYEPTHLAVILNTIKITLQQM